MFRKIFIKIIVYFFLLQIQCIIINIILKINNTYFKLLNSFKNLYQK